MLFDVPKSSFGDHKRAHRTSDRYDSWSICDIFHFVTIGQKTTTCASHSDQFDAWSMCDIFILSLLARKSQDAHRTPIRFRSPKTLLSCHRFFLSTILCSPNDDFSRVEQSVAYAFLNEFSNSCRPKRVINPLKSTSKTHTQRVVYHCGEQKSRTFSPWSKWV